METVDILSTYEGAWEKESLSILGKVDVNISCISEVVHQLCTGCVMNWIHGRGNMVNTNNIV